MNILQVKTYYHQSTANNRTNQIYLFSFGKSFRETNKKKLKIKVKNRLEDLKPKEQKKPIEDKSNNQAKATIIFNDLIDKRKKIMSE